MKIPNIGPSHSPHRSSWRRILCVTLLGCASIALFCAATSNNLNRIQKENRQPGTTAWQLTNPADNRQIEGYASLTSVPVGGDINLFVNTLDATYSLTVYRMGWYAGKGGRKVLGPQTLAGVQQVTPTADPNNGLLIECQWTQPFQIHVPTSWLSGVYLVKLHGNISGKESYITFTVRDSRRADLVFQQSVTTYQAYNPWPGEGVGESLYSGATKVSFNRPYGRGFQENTLYGVGAGDFLTHDFGSDIYSTSDLGTGGPSAWEFCMIRWLEHQGYDVTYITNIDLHEDLARLLRGKAFLSVGHDEYWSEEMRSNILSARDQGVSLGFFSANYIYWPITLLPDSSQSPNRTIFAPKSETCGPQMQDSCTFAHSGETEQLITGAMWDEGHIGNGDIVVTTDAQLDHWVFANTGLKIGDVIPGLIGYEYNAFNPAYPFPDGLQILLHTQAPDFRRGIVEFLGGIALGSTFDGKDFDGWYTTGGTLDYTCHDDPISPLNRQPPYELCSNPYPQTPDVRTDWAMTIYQASSGAWVFNAGAIQWSWGLDDYFTGIQTVGVNNGPTIRTQCGYPFFHPGLVSCRNPAIEQITRNVLNQFIAGP